METNFSNALSKALKQIINDNFEKQYRNLISQWRQVVKDSNLILEKVKDSKKYKIQENNSEISEMIERLNNTIDNYNQINSDEAQVKKISEISEDKIEEIGRLLEGNYRKLSLIYYKHNFAENQKNYKELQEKLKKMSKSLLQIQKANEELQKQKENFEETVKETNAKLESLGAIFLNIVLTISITSTMVTVLLNASPKFSLAIVLGSAWLLLSAILFVGIYFQNGTNKREKNNLALLIYFTLTIVTITSFAYGIFTNDGTEQRNDANENQTQNTSIWIK